MQSKITKILLFAILFQCCFVSADAIEIRPTVQDTTIEIIEVDSLPTQFVNYTEIALGLSQRIDNNQIINHSPLMLAKVYFNVSEKLVGKMGIGYSPSSKFKSSQWDTIKFRDLKLEIGFRWNIMRNFITFYHENGIEYNYYYETESKIWEQRIGINFSLGINFRMYEQMKLDISIMKTYNNASFNATSYVSTPLSPIGLKDDKFFNEIFNPLTLQILFLRKL